MATSTVRGYPAVMRIARSFLVVSVFGGTAAHAQGFDCAPPAQANLGFEVIPFDGTADAPTNTTPFVTGVSLEARLIGPDGEIPSTLEDMSIVGGFGARTSVRRLIPAGDLSPGQTITVEADGQIRSTFTVADFRDDAAPDAPGAAVDGVDGGGAGECPSSSSVTVGIQVPLEGVGDAAFFIGAVNGQPTVGADVLIDGASATEEMVLFTQGSVEINVAGVDLAGNVGASVPLKVDVPFRPACECTTSSPSAPAGLIALGALAFVARRRRR